MTYSRPCHPSFSCTEMHLSHLPEGMFHVMECGGVNLGVLDVDLMFPSTAKLSDC
jgi:hypothetical protein